MGIECWNEVGILIGRTEDEGIVNVAMLHPQLVFSLQSFQRSGLRNRVRHIEKRRDTTVSRSSALIVNIGFFRQSRLTKVHMLVDDAW